MELQRGIFLIRKEVGPCQENTQNYWSFFLTQHADLIADGEEILKEGSSRQGNGGKLAFLPLAFGLSWPNITNEPG
jgi:hypothetical protein